jgi:hypothetical protein
MWRRRNVYAAQSVIHAGENAVIAMFVGNFMDR